jgi:transposase
MKVYYGRKIQARGLRQEGLSVKQIADRLAADEQAVRSWIGVSARTRRAGTRGKPGNI